MLGESPKKIVIVEDEWIVARDLKNSLIKLGYEVYAIASYGMEALESIKINSPDLILMDIKIKGEMDGIETAQRMRTLYDIPVILVTAYGDKETISKAVSSNASAYLIKPFKSRELQASIEIPLLRNENVGKISKKRRVKKK